MSQVTTLPMQEDTRSLIQVFIENIWNAVVQFTNGTGSSIADRTFIIDSVGHSGVVQGGPVANGAVGDLRVEEGLIVQASSLVSGEATFGTVGQDVFYKSSTGEFSDTLTAGYYLVGKLIAAKDSNGMIKFEKTRFATLINDSSEYVAPNSIGWISFPVTADATTALSKDYGFNFTILNAFVASDATNASATLKLQDSSDNDISDAIAATPVTTITNAGTIDGATNEYNAIADGVVKVIANGAADRGTVWMLVQRGA